MASLPEDVFDPEEEALTTDRRQRLLGSVRRLPTDLREVVACRYLLELSEAETAVALQLPHGTVKSRLHRALASLRREVGDG
jgi:RNA polymerase sigma-70 factor (ECF subfamily)